MTEIETCLTPDGDVIKTDEVERKTPLPDIIESPADSINEKVYNAWRKWY